MELMTLHLSGRHLRHSAKSPALVFIIFKDPCIYCLHLHLFGCVSAECVCVCTWCCATVLHPWLVFCRFPVWCEAVLLVVAQTGLDLSPSPFASLGVCNCRS